MLPAAHALVAELDAETPATRRVLERLPDDRFDWRPHQKSLSAGQLAQHIASIPGTVARIAGTPGMDVSTRLAGYASCGSREALLATLDASVASAHAALAGLDDAAAGAPWRFTFGDHLIFAKSRIDAIRTIAFNHWYHHRGELVVYLRLLGVPVPVVYGRSADESPFAAPAA